MNDEEVTLDLGAELGAEDTSSAQAFLMYFPDRDKEGNSVSKHREWIEEALALLSEINGGATATSPMEGAWKNDAGVLIREQTVIVYSYIRTEPFLKSLPRIRELLRRFSRETGQGEVAFEFGQEFFRIRKFDGR